VLRHFANLKERLMPYLLRCAELSHQTGVPMMRPMHMMFPQDETCVYLDRQYMLGEDLLVAPVFSSDGTCNCYLPKGQWTHLLTKKQVDGGVWHSDHYDYFSLPLFQRSGTTIL
jgi:alpha-D-xyloside xylohydrolase